MLQTGDRLFLSKAQPRQQLTPSSDSHLHSLVLSTAGFEAVHKTRSEAQIAAQHFQRTTLDAAAAAEPPPACTDCCSLHEHSTASAGHPGQLDLDPGSRMRAASLLTVPGSNSLAVSLCRSHQNMGQVRLSIRRLIQLGKHLH